MRFLAQASTVACFISVVWEARAAIVVRQVTSAGLERRAPDQAFLGGWSLRAMTCPSGHEKCGAAKGMPACCPTGM